jgi:F0F1-type ATP synthase beta subunit
VLPKQAIFEPRYQLAQEIRRTLAQYAQLKDIIAMLGLEQLSREDRNVVARAPPRAIPDPAVFHDYTVHGT